MTMDDYVELYREHGQWYIAITTKRWIVDEISQALIDGGQLKLASTGLKVGSEPGESASLLIAVHAPPKQDVPDEPVK